MRQSFVVANHVKKWFGAALFACLDCSNCVTKGLPFTVRPSRAIPSWVCSGLLAGAFLPNQYPVFGAGDPECGGNRDGKQDDAKPVGLGFVAGEINRQPDGILLPILVPGETRIGKAKLPPK